MQYPTVQEIIYYFRHEFMPLVVTGVVIGSTIALAFLFFKG